MTEERKLVRKLQEDKIYHVKVLEILPFADKFKSGNAVDGIMKCHFIKAEYVEFPDPIDLQWCNENKTVTEFQVEDMISVIAGVYVIGKNRQSVKFNGVIKIPSQKELLEKVTEGKIMNSKGEVYADGGRINSNPQVAGSLWSVCLTSAVNFHKDRPLSTTDNVTDTIEAFLEHYQKILF